MSRYDSANSRNNREETFQPAAYRGRHLTCCAGNSNMSCEPKKATWSSVGRISHSTRARLPHLNINVRRFFRHHISGGVDHAIGASRRVLVHALRDQAEKRRARCDCTLICAGMTPVDQAARFNSSLTHHVGLFATGVPLHGRALKSRLPFFAVTFRGCGSIGFEEFKLMNG